MLTMKCKKGLRVAYQDTAFKENNTGGSPNLFRPIVQKSDFNENMKAGCLNVSFLSSSIS